MRNVVTRCMPSSGHVNSGGGLSKFPPPLVGMILFFGTMLSLEEGAATKFVNFFEPGVTLLTHFLPVFFMPGLLNAPAAMWEFAVVDLLKFFLVIGLGVSAMTIKTAYLSEYIIKLTKTVPPPPAPSSHGKFTPWFSGQVEILVCLVEFTI